MQSFTFYKALIFIYICHRLNRRFYFMKGGIILIYSGIDPCVSGQHPQYAASYGFF